ncbi:hypothetical protein Tco_0089601 [Tanacetum coccineum]
MSNSSSMSKGFQPKFTPKLIQSSQHAQSSQGETKVLKDYKAEYKKMKAKLTLRKASPSTSQSPKPFQTKNKCFVDETFDWDEEEVYDDEEMTQVKVLMALADDELSVGKNHARNDDLLALKQANLEAVTFQIQNTKLTKLNHALQDQLKYERKVNEKWLNSSNKVSQCITEQIPNQKKKILGGEQLTESSSKNDVKENPFIPASLDYDHEMVPKSKDWVERLKPYSKLPNFNIGRILVPENHSLRERPGLGTMKHTKPETQECSNKSVLGTVTVCDTKPVTSLVPTKVKINDQKSKIDELTKLVQMLTDEKINSTQMI